MKWNWHVQMLTLGLMVMQPFGGGVGSVLRAQVAADVSGLRTQLERRFDVLPLQDGVLLRPRGRTTGVRSIEVHEGVIAVDGQPMSGAELRVRLGADADLVLRASYLTRADLQTLAGIPVPPASAIPGASAPLPDAPNADGRDAPDSRDGRRTARDRARDRIRDRVRDAMSGRRGDGSGDRVRFGGSVTVREDEVVDGDVVVFGGSARVSGRVDGDVVVFGGRAELGPKADVRQDVVVIGGTLSRDPGAQVGGEVQEVGVGPFTFGNRDRQPRNWSWSWPNPFAGVSSLFMTTVRAGILCLLSVLVLLLGGGTVDRIRGLAAENPLKAGGIGVLSQVLAIPLTVVVSIVLIITIVGIPFLLLMPFVFLALGLLALVGFTAVARHLGGSLLGRLGGGTGVYMATLAGVLAILSPVLLARLIGIAGGPLWLVSTPLVAVGLLAEYAAWTVGMGAVLVALFGGNATTVPPPIPQP